MKILLLTYDYPPSVGGIANILATFMRLAGDSEFLILAPGSRGARAFDRAHPIRTSRYPILGGDSVFSKMVNFFSALLWTAFWLLWQRPDIVMAGQLVRAGPIAYIWHRWTGRPYCIWVYGGETSAQFLASRGLTRQLHRVLKRGCTVFTNSPFTTREMRDFGIAPEKVVELPRGVDRELFSPMPKEPSYVKRFGLEGKVTFMTLGRLIERKGVDMMLRAFSELLSELPPWHYLIVSDGPYRQTLEVLTDQLKLRENVTFTGYIEGCELPVYYNLCDVFAMPNREVKGGGKNVLSVEGFGTVFIEAAACGKPVIAGRSGGAFSPSTMELTASSTNRRT